MSCKSLSSTDEAVWYPGNSDTVFLPSVALHVDKKPHLIAPWEDEPRKGDMNIQQVGTHTGTGACGYISGSDNYSSKITHTAPEGMFFPAGASKLTPMWCNTGWCNGTWARCIDLDDERMCLTAAWYPHSTALHHTRQDPTLNWTIQWLVSQLCSHLYCLTSLSQWNFSVKSNKRRAAL